MGRVPIFWVSLNWLGQFTASQPQHVSLWVYKYNEWMCKLEIWIHYPQPSPHPGFWVVGGDNFGSSTLRFTPRWNMFGLNQEFHSISTLPASHYKYNEWLEKVEIGIWALKWSPQLVFQSWVGSKLAWPLSTFHTKVEWVWTDWGNSQHLNPINASLYV